MPIRCPECNSPMNHKGDRNGCTLYWCKKDGVFMKISPFGKEIIEKPLILERPEDSAESEKIRIIVKDIYHHFYSEDDIEIGLGPIEEVEDGFWVPARLWVPKSDN